MMKIFTTLFSLLFAMSISAQNTVGLLSYQPWKSLDGYNLIYPHNQANVYLLNNCGEIVHRWDDEPNFRPGNTAYITEEGNLIKTKRPSDISAFNIWAGGGGQILEMRDWDNNLMWDFDISSDSQQPHHDIEVLPNGNVLMIVWELISFDEALAFGRDTSLMANNEMWPDKIIEYSPDMDAIVWEWRAWDHLIQDKDPNLPNFGVIADNPGRININYDDNDGSPDWMHVNAIDFDPMNNHIIISVPNFHELWIIDHSTSTEEAAGTVGGFGGKGGDLLYRWGNPAAYDQGTSDDQELFYQHDVHYIIDYVDPFHPLFGKIGLFNNRIGADFSAASVISPAFDMYLNEFGLENGRYLPESTDFNLTHPDPQAIYSTGLSSFQVLNNDNFLISSGRFGYTIELTPDDEIVWEYKTPTNGQALASQGDSLSINNNLTFRVKRLPIDYVAFDGKDLTPQGYLEMNPNLTFCPDILPTNNPQKYNLKVFPNPASDYLVIEWEAVGMMDFYLFDIYGRKLQTIHAIGGRKHLDVSKLNPGMYFINSGETESVSFIITE